MARPSLKAALDTLLASRQAHVEIIGATWRADGDALYWNDLIANAVAQRSLHLVDGFVSLVRKRNLACAAPLIRLQLDNVLRLYAASMFRSGRDVFDALIAGTPLSRLKAPDGSRLHDAYLKRKAGEVFPWLPSVYDATSGFIHLSSPGILAPFIRPAGDGTFDMGVGLETGRPWSLAERMEAVEAFTEATTAVLKMLASWHDAKAREAARRVNPAQ
jgi:hypothetical protein